MHLAAPPVLPPARLRAARVAAGYGTASVLSDLSLAVGSGRLTALVGPNGSGKSTLLAALARLLPLRAGTVTLDGADLRARPSREVAREIAVLPQAPIVPEGVTVPYAVFCGRYPHQSWRKRWTDADAHAVEEALRLTGTLDLAARPVADLSGGQRQRAWIAMALAQETGIVLLDEPTSALDPHYQEEILDLLRRLAHEAGPGAGAEAGARPEAGSATDRTVVVVLHDLNLAAAHADDMVFLRAGRVVAAGPTETVCTASVIEEVFGLAVHVLAHPETRRPIFAPRRAAR